MEDTDFVTLPPRGAAKLGWLVPPTPGKPGRYSLRAIYRNDPAAKPMRGGEPRPPTQTQLDRLAKTVPCELRSNALAFDWDGHRANHARR